MRAPHDTVLAPEQERAVAHVRRLSHGTAADPSWRVTLSFHPDRPVAGSTVLEAVVRDNLYRSQFETGVSNGGLTAHPGGDRWRWESAMFGGAYDHAPARLRPVYGALDTRGDAYGGAPRFGSSYLRLRARTLRRSTFCYPDSVFEPTRVGVLERCGDVVAAYREDAPADPLDHYVEAQVHGPVTQDDVEAVVLDPSFRGTPVEQVARGLGAAVAWTPGRVLHPSATDREDQLATYRGPEVLDVARLVAAGGALDAAVLGRAAATGRHDPQVLKRVWHLLARFGGPAP